MHIEVLVEDGSGARMVQTLLPKVIGEQGQPHSWRIHDFKGIGRIPKGLGKKGDPVKMTLLDRLPGILRAHGKTQGIDAVVVVLDSDSRDCKQFLGELQALLQQCDPAPRTLFRLAIEEMEAWYLERVMHFYVPAKAGKGARNEAQHAPRLPHRKRAATKGRAPFPAFPAGWLCAQALAALQRLPRHGPWRRTAPCDHQRAEPTRVRKSA